MSFHDKAQYLREQLRMISATLDLDGIVLVTSDMVMRWPPCEPSCSEPTTCTVKVFRSAADVLDEKAEELEGRAE